MAIEDCPNCIKHGPDDFELCDIHYLYDLSERLREIPVMYGIDGGDIDRVRGLANDLTTKRGPAFHVIFSNTRGSLASIPLAPCCNKYPPAFGNQFTCAECDQE